MAGAGQFDIYESPVGVTAVTSPVQRQILQALGDGELQLPEIMELTGKAKSTLSSIHMKELLSRELVSEEPHPTDSRRKVYRLVGRRMHKPGSGADTPPEVALAEARAQAPTHVDVPRPGRSIGHPSATVPLAAVFQTLAAAPTRADATLKQQARALGRRFAGHIPASDASALAAGIARFVETERLARHLQLDFESIHFRCVPGAAVIDVPPERMGLLLAGFSEGVAEGNALEGVEFVAAADGDAFTLSPNRS